MDHVLEQGYRQLSTGQTRKLLLLSRISSGSQWLLIQSLLTAWTRLAAGSVPAARIIAGVPGMGILAFVYDPGDIPASATHIAVIENGHMPFKGVSTGDIAQAF